MSENVEGTGSGDMPEVDMFRAAFLRLNRIMSLYAPKEKRIELDDWFVPFELTRSVLAVYKGRIVLLGRQAGNG
jgi:hypothetical protein